jgi:hypothetical protein
VGAGVSFLLLKSLNIEGSRFKFRTWEAVEAAGSGKAWIGSSQPPYCSWTWKETDERVGGPNFLVLPGGGMIAATRVWRRGRPSTALCAMTLSSLNPILVLPSGGDCGYPGMVLHRGILWISYYSSHEGKSRIYLARVRIPL